jgi:hypothetical protein
MNRMTALGIEQAEKREDLRSKMERIEVCVCTFANESDVSNGTAD